MLNLLGSIYEAAFSEINYNILIVGHENCGKTTFFEQIKVLYNNTLQKEQEGNTEAQSRLGAVPAKDSGMLIPASLAVLQSRHITPTVGLNYAKVNHRPAAVRVPKDMDAMAPSVYTPVESLPQSAAQPTDATKDTFVWKPCTLTLWDVGGQRSLRVLWKNYFKSCQGIIFIVDSTLHLKSSPPLPPPSSNNLSAQSLYVDYHDSLKYLLQQDELEGVPFLILGNKCDVPGHLNISQLQLALALSEIAADDYFYIKALQEAANGGLPPSSGGFGSKSVKVMECSALLGVNLAVGMDWLVRQIQLHGRTVEPTT